MEFISKLTHPKLVSPVFVIIGLIAFEKINFITVSVIALTTLVAVFAGYLELEDSDSDDYSFSKYELREKRYLLLAIGVIFYGALSALNFDDNLRVWFTNSRNTLIFFLCITIITRFKFSAHVYFWFLNLSLLSLLYSPYLLLIFITLFIILIGSSRVALKKHTFLQIISTYCISLIIFFIVWIK